MAKVIQQESYQFKDSITEFLSNLYVEYDFDAATKSLSECKTLFEKDYFIHGKWSEFYENANLLQLENYCCIFQSVDIA